MGIYDRDYARDENKGIFLGGDRMLVTNLVLLNIGIYVAQLLIPRLTAGLALRPDLFGPELLKHPWEILQPLTYGFAHSRDDLLHIVGNMFLLWFFGRDIEMKYGRRAFLGFYLTGIIISGLAWLAVEQFTEVPRGLPLVGASGGVMGVMVVYVLNFPKRVLYVWGVLPVPAWALGALWLLGDIYGAFDRSGNVAYTAHLAGAAFGLLFYQTGWSLLNVIPRNLSVPKFKRPPKLRVHDPDEAEEEMSRKVDEILDKIRLQGQDSLTPQEKKTLEKASRRYQQKHR